MVTMPGDAPEALGQDAADAFTAWLGRDGYLGKIDEDQCTAMARVFVAGYVLGAMREGTP